MSGVRQDTSFDLTGFERLQRRFIDAESQILIGILAPSELRLGRTHSRNLTNHNPYLTTSIETPVGGSKNQKQTERRIGPIRDAHLQGMLIFRHT